MRQEAEEAREWAGQRALTQYFFQEVPQRKGKQTSFYETDTVLEKDLASGRLRDAGVAVQIARNQKAVYMRYLPKDVLEDGQTFSQEEAQEDRTKLLLETTNCTIHATMPKMEMRSVSKTWSLLASALNPKGQGQGQDAGPGPYDAILNVHITQPRPGSASQSALACTLKDCTGDRCVDKVSRKPFKCCYYYMHLVFGDTIDVLPVYGFERDLPPPVREALAVLQSLLDKDVQRLYWAYVDMAQRYLRDRRELPPDSKRVRRGGSAKTSKTSDTSKTSNSKTSSGPLDIDRLRPASHAAKDDPWPRIAAFIAKNATPPVTQYRQEVSILRTRFKGRPVVFEVIAFRLFTGELKEINLRTTVTRPKLANPLEPFDHAIRMEIHRGTMSATAVRAAVAYLGTISKKPSHGLDSGSDSLELALRLCRALGCSNVSLFDASHLPCSVKHANVNVPLRAARILARGSGWYESRGFHSLLEDLNPAQHRLLVDRLHRLPLKDLTKNLADIDRSLRQAILAPSLAKTSIQVHDQMSEKFSTRTATVADIVAIMGSVSVALGVMQDGKPESSSKSSSKPRTLGAFMDSLVVGERCEDASRFIRALLDGQEDGKVMTMLLKDADGAPVPQLLEKDSWLYVWRLVTGMDSMLHLYM